MFPAGSHKGGPSGDATCNSRIRQCLGRHRSIPTPSVRDGGKDSAHSTRNKTRNNLGPTKSPASTPRPLRPGRWRQEQYEMIEQIHYASRSTSRIPVLRRFVRIRSIADPLLLISGTPHIHTHTPSAVSMIKSRRYCDQSRLPKKSLYAEKIAFGRKVSGVCRSA